MKTRKLAFALAMSAISLLTGCGSSGGGNPASNVGAQIGCAQWSGNVCTVPIYAGAGGCTPLTQAIYFVGTGTTDGYQLIAGKVSGYATNSYGALQITTTPPTAAAGQLFSSTSGLSFYELHTSGTSASVYGQMLLSSQAQQNIVLSVQQYYASQGNYTTVSPASVCVSGVGLNVYDSYPSVNGVTGYIYLSLNNIPTPYALRLF